jgi:hypothetical protein
MREKGKRRHAKDAARVSAMRWAADAKGRTARQRRLCDLRFAARIGALHDMQGMPERKPLPVGAPAKGEGTGEGGRVAFRSGKHSALATGAHARRFTAERFA